jgi:hypothetical protein
MTEYLEDLYKTSVFDFNELENFDIVYNIDLYEEIFEGIQFDSECEKSENKVNGFNRHG